ncbi:papain-like cysteine protease family protein [Oleiagrimonas sp. MCCC 1A03011]|uniref:papain-like cysteine protease family protein n=1 Tax=Oleiagrimonas sp. MCCC 1A03011 TaxID=1926883 RepID=UPI000DC3F732|nr:papain-like cysteine protease family protein [Oleiagrimonas sp. MCCC 1A03011]RAP56111.1 hypothetical protein BTJ49_14345 [Oleiagrimonas sp. MCCC 1A03011]
MKRIFGLLFVVFSAFPVDAWAKVPPPVDLGIQNLRQETPVWCWVAVARQIVMWTRGQPNTPPQCALVAAASHVPVQACCRFPTPCTRTGSLQEIQGLILHFGGHYSSISPPANPMAVYRTLASGRAIIMAVQSSPYSGHVVVIRGMAWLPTPSGFQPVLYINDPMDYFTRPVPFVRFIRYWRAAIVVY